MKPTMAINRPASAINKVDSNANKPRLTAIGNTASKLSTIATPPPRGVGRWCELLAFGTSTTFRASAYLRNNPVIKRLHANTKTVKKTKFTVLALLVFI